MGLDLKMENKYRGKSWDQDITFRDETWHAYDLSETDFLNVVFKNVVFKECLFSKSKLTYVGFYGCSFFDCDFDRVNLRDAPFGASSGLFHTCRFFKCDLRGQDFASPRFEQCLFDSCKLKQISFNDSTFSQCKFIGKLEDVSFNGIYRRQPSRYLPLDCVDFSDASFGEFVNFYNSCDLTTCIPPKGTSFDSLLYNIYRDDATVRSTGSSDKIVLTRHRKI